MISVLLFLIPLARAQVVPITTTTTPPPSSLSDQSTSSDSRYWTDHRVSEIFLFIAFFFGCFFFAYLFYAYAMKRKRRAATSQEWNGAYGPRGYGNAHTHTFTQDRGPYSQSGYAALGTQPGCEQYPPPPLYAQAMYTPEPHVPIPKQYTASARTPPLSRAASSASTSTLVGYGSNSKDNKGDGRRLSEDDEDNAPVLESQLARPQPAKQSTWRGRFARLGDRA
ncbi:hypothetical protein CspHIS471_0313880 [Cutaneotrichosporon sp. HIS471]|nr:hypothetical protein CspHIS471_0313880 [Cutaneotrichosporon sp. HIS471]